MRTDWELLHHEIGGGSMCKTPYFLLLDGHMRFYKKYWNREIINILENDDRVLLCCQSKVLEKMM